jgi:hypothetical protein
MTQCSRPIMKLYLTNFTNGLSDLCELLILISSNLPLSPDPCNVESIAHKVLQRKCEKICEELKNETFECAKFIKKIFSVITDNTDKFLNLDKTLFELRTHDNKIITVVPSLDISLVYSFLNDDERNRLWNDIYLVYICSVELLFMKQQNRVKLSRHIYDNLNNIYNKMNAMNGKFQLVNIYSGVNTTDNILDIDNLFKQFEVKNSEAPDATTALSVFSNLNSTDKLYEQILTMPDLTDDNITEINTVMTQFFGDSSLNPLFTDIIGNLQSEVKHGQHNDLNSLLSNMMQNVDVNKFKSAFSNPNPELMKTMNQFQTMISSMNPTMLADMQKNLPKM